MGKKEIYIIAKCNRENDGEMYMSAWHEYNWDDAIKSIKLDFRGEMEIRFESDDEWSMDMLHQSMSNEYYYECDGGETHYHITKALV